MRSLPFLFGEAWINLRRHGLMTAAAISTIAVALSLLGGFLLTFYQVDAAARKAALDFEMRVFCRLEINKSDVPGLQKRMESLPGVASVRYISKEDAFREQTKNLPIDTAGLPNQFNETFVVKMRDPSKASQAASAIRGWHDQIEEVSLPETEMHGVLKIAGFLRTVGLGGGVLLLGGALLVVSNTIRVSVFARRREIKIMQIVGASAWFIRLPLLLEGVLHGLAGGLLAGLMLGGVSAYVGGLIQNEIPLLVAYGNSVDLARVGLVAACAGVWVGLTGSLWSVQRYLKVT